MPAPTTLLHLAARRAAPAVASRHAAAVRPFQSAAHQDNKLRLKGENGEVVPAEHDTLHENKEYLEHEKNLVRRPLFQHSRRRLARARDQV